MDEHLVFRDKDGHVLPVKPAALAPGTREISATNEPPMPRFVGIPDIGYAIARLCDSSTN